MRKNLIIAGIMAATLSAGVVPLLPPVTPKATASADNRLADMASPSPFRGLLYNGLSLGKGGSTCEGAFEAKDRRGASLGCSHGPDPAPSGVDVRRGRGTEQVAAEAAAGALGRIGCIGDGISDSRVQAIYAVAADRPDRSATVVPAIRSAYAPRVDWQFNQSAAETGSEAHVVFVTEPSGTGCTLSVAIVQLTAAGDDSFSNTMSELTARGFNRPDRKYLVWTDAEVLCGIGTVYADTRPDPAKNYNNRGYAPMFARVDTACWNHAEGHELMHTLGAVQVGAPHATANGHCVDEPDDMCYDDDGNGPATMIQTCGGRNDALFDCNHDDYFYAGTPPAGNWLATSWNTFNSSWLLRAPLPATGTTTTTSTSTSTTLVSPTATDPAQRRSGYWMLTIDGHVYPFGDARSFGQPFPGLGGARAVDLDPSPSGAGYWVLDSSGRVRAFGDAVWSGDVPAARLSPGEQAVSLSATPSGAGYWVFTSRGRAVTFGDAGFFGDLSVRRLNQPVIGSVSTTSGRGYYLLASDGGIFSFGDAPFFGSTGAMRLNKPVVAMAVAPGGAGYWLVGSDGGVFAFGAARFFGSTGHLRLNRPVSAVVTGAAGYLMVGEDGGAFSFGDVAFFGSLGSDPPPTPVAAVALKRAGST